MLQFGNPELTFTSLNQKVFTRELYFIMHADVIDPTKYTVG